MDRDRHAGVVDAADKREIRLPGIRALFARKPIVADENTGLKRVLGAPQIVALGIGEIIGAGLFSLTGIAAGDFAGPAVVLSFAVAAVGCGFTGLCYSELAAMIPSAGSAYAYSYASLGELAAWIIGWDLLLEASVGAGTVAVSWSKYVQSLLHDGGIDLPHWMTAAPGTGGLFDLPAALIVVLITGLLIAGVSQSARVNAVIVAVKIAVVLVVIGLGAFSIDPANYHPFVPPNTGQFGTYGWSGVLRGAGIVFFAFLGFDVVSTTAGEAKEPQRAVPIGILGSLVICTVLYIAFAVVLTGLVNYKDLHGDAAPVATAMRHTPYPWLQAVVKLGVVLGCTSVLLVGLLGQGRIMFMMARDGMLPGVFGRLQPARKSPWVAHATTMAVTVALAGLFPVEVLSRMTSVGTLLAFAMVCGGMLTLRITDPDRPRPFRVPAGPLVALFGIATCGLMLAFLPGETWLRLGVWLALGLVVYTLYSHRRAAAERDAVGRSELTLSDNPSRGSPS